MNSTQSLILPEKADLVEAARGVPTEEIVRQIKTSIDNGSYQPGARLPSERRMADELQVGRKAVTAAYAELEDLGLLRRFRGKGAFVSRPLRAGMAFSWSGKISEQAHVLDEPVLQQIAGTFGAPIAYPFAAGTPSLTCFPLTAFRESLDRVSRHGLPGSLALAPAEGQGQLRTAIAQMMQVEARRVMVTAGAQEGVDLIARCLIDPGEAAIVESPTYPGVLQSLRAAGARLLGWETDWSLRKLESHLTTHRAKLIFTSPTYQNPTGRVMPLETRMGLLELAARHHVPIIEDDVYSRAPLGGATAPPSLLSLDRQNVVAYISTFSKILAPGLRIGWVVGAPHFIKQLALMKMRANLFTEGLLQQVLADMIERGTFDQALRLLCEHHTLLRNCAMEGLEEAVRLSLLQFEVPAGGLYLWCRVPKRSMLERALELAEKQGVIVAPGQAFFLDGAGETHFRLCFTALTPEQITMATKILTTALRDAG